MTTVSKDIMNGLESHLQEMTNLPTVIVYENTSYTPTPGVPFIRVSTQPAQPTVTSIGIDGLNTQSGIFLINTFWNKGVGRAVQDTFLAELTTKFKRGTIITNNGVSIRIESVGPQPSIEEDEWFHVPVQIQYIAYTAN